MFLGLSDTKTERFIILRISHLWEGEDFFFCQNDREVNSRKCRSCYKNINLPGMSTCTFLIDQFSVLTIDFALQQNWSQAQLDDPAVVSRSEHGLTPTGLSGAHFTKAISA